MIRISVLLLTVFALSACGFRPLYGTGGLTTMENGTVRAQINDIEILPIPNREGQYLYNELLDRLYLRGIPQDAAYTLAVAPISERLIDLDITKTATATRAQLTLSTSFTLKDNRSGEMLLERDLRTISSFNILDSRFTTRISEQSTRENALKDLARQIETQLALYFQRQNNKPALRPTGYQ